MLLLLRNCFALLFVACVFPVSLYAQELRGTVLDRQTGEAVSYASIQVNGKNAAIADSNGAFRLQLSPGNSRISISRLGFVSYYQTVKLSEDDKLNLIFYIEKYANELQRVVISSTRHEREIAREAISIVTIQPHLITNTNSNTLSDVINRVPGISMVDGQAIIRGGVGWGYNVGSRVTVLLDDMPLMGPDAGDIQWDMLPIEAAENIEVMKGPASVLYGSSASSGSISIRTGWPTNRPETKMSLYQGITANPKRAYAAWWGRTSQPFNSGAFFSHKQKFGQFDLVWSGNIDLNKSYIEYSDQIRARNYLKTRYRFKQIPGLTAGINGSVMFKKGGQFFLWKDADSNILRPFDGSVGENNYLMWTIDPHIVYAPSERYSIALRMRHYTVHRYIDKANIHAFNRLNDADANMEALDLNYQRKWFEGFSTTTGTYLTRMWAVGNLYPGTFTGYSAAVFTQGEYAWKKKLTLTAGIRYEVNAVGDVRKSPGPLLRAGVNYKALKKTYLRATYGEGFRFPAITERFIDDELNGIRILPNVGLKNEFGWYTEFGVKQGFAIGGFNASLDGCFFWQEYKNLIQFEFKQWKEDSYYFDYRTTPPLFVAVPGIIGFKAINIGNSRTAGLEFSLEGEGSIGQFGLRTLCGYTYIYPVDLDADSGLYNYSTYLKNFAASFWNPLTPKQLTSVLPYRNRELSKADVEVSWKKLAVGYGAFYYSRYEKIDPALYILVPGIDKFLAGAGSGDLIHNLRCSYAINSYATVAFLVNNMTNHEYTIRIARIEQPRNFNVQLRLRF